jgi:hypothetical protein
MSAYESIQAYFHEVEIEVDDAITDDPPVDEVDPDLSDAQIMQKGGFNLPSHLRPGDICQPHVPELEADPDPDEAITDNPSVDEAEPEPPDTLLINAEKWSSPTPPPPGDICRVLSKNSVHP